MPARKRRNPFYILLVPVGAVFVVTAFAYGIMAFQAVNGSPLPNGSSANPELPHPLFQWLRIHGDAAMIWELGVLAVLTVAAMATDRIWDPPRSERSQPLQGKP